jgi:hypothetical protein
MERIKRALFKEALAQGTEGTPFSNAMLYKEYGFQSQIETGGADLPVLPQTCLGSQRRL